MGEEELLDLHLSIAELHDVLLEVTDTPAIMLADLEAVEKHLDNARQQLTERRYNLAVLELASAAKMIAKSGSHTARA